VPADDEGQRALAQSYLDAAETNDVDIEGMELGMPSLSKEEMAQGVKMMRSLVEELGEELLNVSRDDVEEVSDLILSVSRVSLHIVQRVTHQALRALEGLAPTDGAGTAAAATAGVVEEATQEEIAEYYRQRGMAPPAAAATPLSQQEKEGTAPQGAQSSTTATRRRRYDQPRPRVLWRPLAPQMLMLAQHTLPNELRAHPFKTAGLVACVLPFSGAILLCLPGLLLADHLVLQRVYSVYGPQLEEAAFNATEVGRLVYVVTRLSLRSCRRAMRKARADPKQAITWAWHAATHPLETAKATFGVASRGLASALELAGSLRAHLM
jgi:hypothetical protein